MPGMEVFAILLICYVGFGAAACATPHDGDWTPLAQWTLFRATFRDVLVWPLALWREFRPS
jgi:hypothetical protein